MAQLLNRQLLGTPDPYVAWLPSLRQMPWRSRPEREHTYVGNLSPFSAASLELQIWRQAGASTVLAPLYYISSLEQLYIFRKPEEVSRFLQVYPFLVPLLLEAHDRIGAYFGPRQEVVLEVVTDPEAVADRQLVAFIQTELHPVEALDRLDQLDEDWWLGDR